MVDIQIARVGNHCASVRPNPEPGLYATAVISCEDCRLSRFGDQRLLPGVLAVTVLVSPVPPLVAIIPRYARIYLGNV